jgi:hypothetical protein
MKLFQKEFTSSLPERVFSQAPAKTKMCQPLLPNVDLKIILNARSRSNRSSNITHFPAGSGNDPIFCVAAVCGTTES